MSRGDRSYFKWSKPNLPRRSKFISVGHSDLQGREALFQRRVRIVDISDPFKPKDSRVLYSSYNGLDETRLKKVIQTNDVDLDYRGLIYITDRAGAGLHILEYPGSK